MESVSNWISKEIFSADFSRLIGMSVVLLGLRIVLLKTLITIGRSAYAETFRITKRPLINEKQLERESFWPLGYFLDLVALALIFIATNLFHNLEFIGPHFFLDVASNLFFHATVVEFIYYWFHRILHVGFVYKNWHQYHHKSINTEPTTALSFEIGERLSYTALFAVAPAISSYLGYESYLVFMLYFLWFDLMNEGGHINFECFPAWFFKTPLKYIFYTPSYHAIHHTRFKKNYSLFMPWPDMIFGSAVWSNGQPEEAVLPTSNQEL